MTADVVDIFLPLFPVQGKQVCDNIQETGDKAAVAFVAQGVDNLHGGIGFAGTADAEQEQAFPPGPEFREMLRVVFGVAGNDRAAPVVVGEVPLAHVGVGKGVAAAVFRLDYFFPSPAFPGDAGEAFLQAVAVNRKGFHFPEEIVQNIFRFVAVAAVQHPVLFVVPGMGAAAHGFFRDKGVAVLLPVVFRRAGDVVGDGRAEIVLRFNRCGVACRGAGSCSPAVLHACEELRVGYNIADRFRLVIFSAFVMFAHA